MVRAVSKTGGHVGRDNMCGESRSALGALGWTSVFILIMGSLQSAVIYHFSRVTMAA